MYHEETVADRRRKRRRLIISVVCCVMLMALIMVGVRVVSAGAKEQGAVALRQSIMDAAMRCCAIEGSYPLSLAHLEESYGLRINRTDYIITYEAFASNMAPSVVVVPR